MTNTRISTPFDLDPQALNELEELLSSFQAKREQTLTGQLIRGRFLSANGREYFFDIGEKEEAICQIDEFDTPPNLGDVYYLAVINWKADGCAYLSKREGDRLRIWLHIKEAFEANANISGKISRILPSGYLIDFEGLELFMPLSHSTLNVSASPRWDLGVKLDFRILELKERYYSAIVSHKVVVEERNETLWDQFLKEFKVNDIIEAVVIKKVSFGVFLEINGLIGLLHYTDISWKKWGSFKSKFPLKSKIQVKILEFDRENNRLRFGLKQLTVDPWEWAKTSLVKDQVVKAKILSTVSFGAFVEIIEGLEGLLHSNEISWDRKKKPVNSYVKIGQEIDLKVVNIDYETKRLNLSLKALQVNPWDELLSKYKVGDICTGKIKNITDFGAFVSIVDGVEGLINLRDFNWDEKPNKNFFRKGQEVQYKILTIDVENQKISCGVKQLIESPLQTFKKKYSNNKDVLAKIKRIAPFGLIVDLEQNREALIPTSEIYLNDNQKLDDLFKVGDSITTLIKDVDFKKRRIYLSLRLYQNKLNQEANKKYFNENGPLTSTPFADALKKIQSK